MNSSTSVLTLLIGFLTVAMLCVPGSVAVADAVPFSFVGETAAQPLPDGTGIHGLARVGTNWFAANFNEGWNIYDSNFVQVGTTTVPGLGETRGLALNALYGNLYAGDLNSGTIFEVTPSGTIVNSFPSGGPAETLNAIAYDPNDDSLYAVHFNGFVSRFSSGGVALNQFTISGALWTGAAFDSVSNTLVLLESASDSVSEYTTSGSLVGIPLAGDSVTENGQGLHYDSATGLLHVTAQEGNIATWQRPVVPEPASGNSYGYWPGPHGLCEIEWP